MGVVCIQSGELQRLLAPLYKCAKGWFGFVNEPVAFWRGLFVFGKADVAGIVN